MFKDNSVIHNVIGAVEPHLYIGISRFYFL